MVKNLRIIKSTLRNIYYFQIETISIMEKNRYESKGNKSKKT